MSKVSVPQLKDENQAGALQGQDGEKARFLFGGVPPGERYADQRKGSPAACHSWTGGGEALGLVSYKTSITVMRDKARLMRVARSIGLTARVME